jgi:hypothetical protein
MGCPRRVAEDEADCTIARPAGRSRPSRRVFLSQRRATPISIALAACLGDPDPAIRDDFAFTLWSEGLRGKHLTPGQMRHALDMLTR